MTEAHEPGRIFVAKEFSRYPSGRKSTDSKFSGETFRIKFLVPMLNENKIVEVYLDDVLGYGSSFLDEAFGGLVRYEGFSSDVLKSRLVIITRYPDLEWEIWSFIRGS